MEFADAKLGFSTFVYGAKGGKDYTGPVCLLDNGWVTFTSLSGKLTYVPGGNVAYMSVTPVPEKPPEAEELVHVPEVEAPKVTSRATKKKSRSKPAGRPGSY